MSTAPVLRMEPRRFTSHSVTNLRNTTRTTPAGKRPCRSADGWISTVEASAEVTRTRTFHRPICGALPRVLAKRATEEMAFYRSRTEGMLLRYTRMSMEAGRVPSMLGRELFRARVTNYEVHSFEDVVIFVCDVEKCLEELDALSQKLLKRIAVQQYAICEVAGMMGMSERSVVRRYHEAVDELTALFLQRKLMEPMDVIL